MKPIAILDIEFLAGSDLKECIEEAKRIARQLNLVFVNFSFNGIKFSISQNPDINNLIKQYEAREDSFICG